MTQESQIRLHKNTQRNGTIYTISTFRRIWRLEWSSFLWLTPIILPSYPVKLWLADHYSVEITVGWSVDTGQSWEGNFVPKYAPTTLYLWIMAVGSWILLIWIWNLQSGTRLLQHINCTEQANKNSIFLLIFEVIFDHFLIHVFNNLSWIV